MLFLKGLVASSGIIRSRSNHNHGGAKFDNASDNFFRKESNKWAKMEVTCWCGFVLYPVVFAKTKPNHFHVVQVDSPLSIISLLPFTLISPFSGMSFLVMEFLGIH